MNYNYQYQQNHYGEDQYSYPCMRNPYYYGSVQQIQMMPSQTNSGMKLSARNQFKGTVVKMNVGDVLGSVLVDIGCGNLMSAIITTDSIRELGIQVGSQVKTVVKSTGVMIMTNAPDNNKNSSEMKLSARNQFKGTVTKIKLGDITSQLLIDTGCTNLMSSVITTDSVRDLGINIGSKVIVVVKATEVMIMA